MFGRITNVHFVGVGGIGMSGIARVLKKQGFNVTGSDLKPTDITKELEGLGIQVFYGHRAENCHEAQVIVYSSAVAPDNPELVWASKARIPVIPRAEMLAELMRMRYSIAVSGTHGKTTTTSMITLVLEEAGLKPTSVIGGLVRGSKTNGQLGNGKYLVAEADESDKSFLLLLPTLAVITNIEEEHLDCYKDLTEIKTAFLDFANRVPFFGSVVACADDPNILDIIPRMKRRTLTYGLSPEAQIRAVDIDLKAFSSSYRIFKGATELGIIELAVGGLHNVQNSLAVIGVCDELGVDFSKVRTGLMGFKGVHRRQELKGEKRGVVVIDDYGHHPTEIKRTLEAVRVSFPKNRLITVFQPHRYTRTKFLHRQFGPAFSLTDILIITDIYPAGEQPIDGVSSELIITAVKELNPHPPDIVHQADFNTITDYILEIVKPGDVILTLGAGNIWQIGAAVLKKL
jgi:UDP-N-acetylmuramate--alanine ligase